MSNRRNVKACIADITVHNLRALVDAVRSYPDEATVCLVMSNGEPPIASIHDHDTLQSVSADVPLAGPIAFEE
jgi:hypothetical protein